MSTFVATAGRPARARQAARAFALTAIAALLLGLPWWGTAWLGRAVEIAYMLSLAMLWNLLAGFAGVVSIGQQAFVGLGGYALFALVILAGVPPLAALPLAGVVAAVVALPVALLLFRLRGPHLAIGSWVVAEVFRLVAAQISALGGGSGQSLPVAAVRGIARSRSAREAITYFIALALAALCLALVWGLLRARQGLGLTAMRDSEAAAASLGVNVRRLKLTVFVAVAGATGLLGALIFLQTLRISPDAAFSVTDWTANVIFIVVIGGIGTLEGPFAGTAVFFLFRGLFAGFGGWYMIALGALAILVMLLAPAGLCGAVSHRFGVTLFPMRRRLGTAPAAAPGLPTASPN
ncbi:MAG TPA: branched-chain amino acid ABC transporter permease [Acetobacteraceae bacterium]|nr:branched-chain amino acid ABC transporter permease [Acetobacteraceae bacterium]